MKRDARSLAGQWLGLFVALHVFVFLGREDRFHLLLGGWDAQSKRTGTKRTGTVLKTCIVPESTGSGPQLVPGG